MILLMVFCALALKLRGLLGYYCVYNIFFRVRELKKDKKNSAFDLITFAFKMLQFKHIGKQVTVFISPSFLPLFLSILRVFS